LNKVPEVNNVIDLSPVIALEAALEFGHGDISKLQYLLEKVVGIRAEDGSCSEGLLAAFRPLVDERLSNCCLSLVLTVTNQAEHWTMHQRVLLFSVIGIAESLLAKGDAVRSPERVLDTRHDKTLMRL